MGKDSSFFFSRGKKEPNYNFKKTIFELNLNEKKKVGKRLREQNLKFLLLSLSPSLPFPSRPVSGSDLASSLPVP